MFIVLHTGPTIQNSEEGEEMENDIEENVMDDEDDNDDESHSGSDEDTLNDFESNVLEDNIPEPGPEADEKSAICESAFTVKL